MNINNYDYFLGSTSFMLGCISYTIDAIRQDNINFYILSGCILFDIGCIFFIKDSLKKEKITRDKNIIQI
jgi:hypothetical protein